MKTNHRFNGFAVFFAAIFAALAFAFVMAGCEQPTSPADSFVPVTGITGVPDTGAAGTELDLTGARVEPYNATGQTIVWTVKNAGTTGVTAITGGKATPATAGILIVTATIANGRAGGQNHTQDFTINIGAAGSFVPVTGISGVPPAMVKNTELDLNAASVTPANATNKTITWTLIDAGT
ncbi:MAG: hypothetical protein LBK62_01025, partial [Treponema sp.]|nr:hypothetical protein [Treponema sp.]